ncbi:MAG TPA: hypothetical protein VFB99_05570, partial [Vicinamibacterales bacterium]|nr:hypothetical protein [Vicinamibacterales bacterium]
MPPGARMPLVTSASVGGYAPGKIRRFRHLRILERHRGVFEVGTGVDQLPIEPELVERIPEVVMVVDVVARVRKR